MTNPSKKPQTPPLPLEANLYEFRLDDGGWYTAAQFSLSTAQTGAVLEWMGRLEAPSGALVKGPATSWNSRLGHATTFTAVVDGVGVSGGVTAAPSDRRWVVVGGSKITGLRLA